MKQTKKRTNASAWKTVERAIASLLGGVRSPHDGHGGVDIEHPTLYPDVKSRRNISPVFEAIMMHVEDIGCQIAVWGEYALVRITNVAAIIRGTSKLCVGYTMQDSEVPHMRANPPQFVQDVIEHMSDGIGQHKLPCAILHYPRRRYADAILVATKTAWYAWHTSHLNGWRVLDDIETPTRRFVNPTGDTILTLSAVLMPTPYASTSDVIARVTIPAPAPRLWGGDAIYIRAEHWSHVPGTTNTTAWSALRQGLQQYGLPDGVINSVMSHVMMWHTEERADELDEQINIDDLHNVHNAAQE